jgi:catecholate siderophore receptor
MSRHFEPGRPATLASLRAGAALAVVLGVTAGALPAVAQTAPEAAPAVSGPLDGEPQEGQRGERRDDRDGRRDQIRDERAERRDDRVFVFGRRVSTSVATLPSVEEAPQVVNVITAETLAEQGVASLEQALRNVPGITTQIGEGGVMSGDQFFIRGLSAKNDIFTDGLRDFGVYTRDSFNYGQVEVFKGPSASAFGRGAAGGGINTSSKTPYSENAGNLSLSGGEGEYLRATGDWNQVLGDGVAVRIAAMAHHNENTGRDKVYSDRWGVAPSIGFFSQDGATSMTLAYLHQDEEKLTDYGIPTVTANGVTRPVSDFGVDSKTFYGYEADVDETTVDTVTARLRHQVNDWLTLTNDTRYGFYQRYARFSPVSCPTPTAPATTSCSTALTDNNPATIPLVSVGGPGPWDQDTQGVQNLTTASITAPIGGLRSELMVGLDVSWQNNDRNQYSYAGTRAPKNIFTPAFTPNPALLPGKANIRDTTARDVSLFANERLWFTDQLSIIGGVRVQSYEVDQNTTTFTTSGTTVTTTYAPVSSKTDFVTPQIGVIFEPTDTQHYYINYASSAKPPGVSVNNGDTIAAPTTPGGVGSADLDPEENTNIEIGGRIGLFGNRAQFQGAVFQTKKENAKETDPALGTIVRSGDSQEITGVELGLAGAITDQWSMNVNATYLDTETTESATLANIGKAIPFVPETAASLWTTYNFGGGLAGLEIGGGVTYQGEVWLNAANTAQIPSQTTLDGLVSYGFGRYLLSVNAYNLTDELYFAQVHGNRVTPGQGRTFIATLGVAF